jgi:cytidylate kinase
MLITISGLSGSGKSSSAKRLAERLGIPTVDIGTIFRAMAKRRKMDVATFGRYAEAHPEIDRELDAAMVRRAKRADNLILQGRLAGWMSVLNDLPAYRIWIGATARTRASRVAKREGIPYARALKEITRRDKDNLVRYRRTYGLDLNDLSIYDSVVQTDNLSVEQVVSSLVKTLPKVWPMKPRTPLKKRKIRKAPGRSPRPKK